MRQDVAAFIACLNLGCAPDSGPTPSAPIGDASGNAEEEVTCEDFKACAEECASIVFGEPARRECFDHCEPADGISSELAEDWGWQCAEKGHRVPDPDDPTDVSPEDQCEQGLSACLLIAEMADSD